MDITHQTPAPQDVFTIVTNQVIAQLQSGAIPWYTPFAKNGIPRNLISAEPYAGLNVWLLASLHYPQNIFLTGKQAQSVGASIKKGEKGHIVIYWNRARVLRYYKVFNIAQCVGIPDKLILNEQMIADPIPLCKLIVTKMPNPPAIESGGASVFYDYQTDTIYMPDNEFFTNEETYYSNLFHALALATGHEKRLDRRELLQARRLATPKMYNMDDLIAEMASSFLCSIAGIAPVHLRNNVFDIEGWLFRLRTHSGFIVQASIQAEHAINHIFNIVPSGMQLSLDEMKAEDDIE